MNYYFDNSATSFPKPESVYQALDNFARRVGASAGRGAYREALETGETIEEVRRLILRVIGGAHAERVIFGLNATDALNLALKGVLREGDHAVTTWMDHNSVLRPLSELERRGAVAVTRVECDGEGFVDPADIRRALRPETRLVAVVHASNVCGTIQPIAELAAVAHNAGALMLVDAAQSVGHLPYDAEGDEIDLTAFPGHKGLLGPLGTGALYVRDGIELALLREGGTGSKSEDDVQPAFWPDRHEAGSHNAHGLAGLKAGLEFVLERGLDRIRAHELELIDAFAEATDGVEGLTLYGPRDRERRTAVFSVRVAGLAPLALGPLLDRRYGMKVRAGLHCAPLAHQTLGTFDEGTTRFSFGVFNTVADVRAAAAALQEICATRPLAQAEARGS